MAELRLALALLAVAGGAEVAHADATPMVRAPAGWRADAERAAEVAQAAGKHDGVSATEAYAPAAADTGVALFATRTTAPGGTVDAAVKAFGGGAATVDARGRTVGDLDKHDDGVHVRHRARLIAQVMGVSLVSVVGECYWRDDSQAALTADCMHALDTLELGEPAVVPELAPPPPVPQRPAATMSDGSHVTLPPIAVPPPDSSTDHRPMYVGGGILVLAAVFWWNRKRRDKFETDKTADKTADKADKNELADAAKDPKDAKDGTDER